MASDDADDADPCDVTDNNISDDVVEQGGGARRLPGLDHPVLRWRPSRGAAVLAAVTLLAGLVAGYAAGIARTGGEPAASSRSATAATAISAPVITTISPALVQDGNACSAQVGRNLQLGVQVSNQSGEPVTLRAIKSVLPLRGLKPIALQWTPCGAFPATPVLPGDGLLGQAGNGNRLSPGASVWFTVTFQVLVTCPGPLPVQFTVDYEIAGHAGTASLPGFPDLGQVSYSGCARH
ncbi:MAG TPA: hypothetical protein VK817_13005 [Trebonia sp.]|jgi:hypothetical protein|nr:hypothetical protein [Trebonia sp.]